MTLEFLLDAGSTLDMCGLKGLPQLPNKEYRISLEGAGYQLFSSVPAPSGRG